MGWPSAPGVNQKAKPVVILSMNNKSIAHFYRVDQPHMVGDGFRVKGYLPGPRNLQQQVSPFYLLDYNSPHFFPATDPPRGVGVHPHKGFETVTIVFEGELAHADSTGSSGTIGQDEVQWMTAGAGVLHKEFQTPEFSRAGGVQHMLQLWVNLPARHKQHAPRYQTLTSENIPVVKLDENGSIVRVIGGDYIGVQGAAETLSPLSLLDIRLVPGSQTSIPVPSGWNALLLQVDGEAIIQDSQSSEEGDMAVFGNEDGQVTIRTEQHPSRFILMMGEPLNEPIAAYGPFLMNTQQEIVEAIQEFQSGKFGILH